MESVVDEAGGPVDPGAVGVAGGEPVVGVPAGGPESLAPGGFGGGLVAGGVAAGGGLPPPGGTLLFPGGGGPDAAPAGGPGGGAPCFGAVFPVAPAAGGAAP
jgi:hypothetical protein